ncbi:MAG: alpha-ketoacid dehydrogenase subunit beta [Elusimicrobia bacterium]|nr:alpha-ketoacid dehydrogenase subunit beta [Elusimicrobiota bacterium]
MTSVTRSSSAPKTSPSRRLTFSLAINEAIHQSMAADERVVLLGQGVKSPWYVGNTTRGLLERFGELRVQDTPVSENAVTGAAVGMAIAGLRPIVVHPRVDFLVYALDPILNQAANWRYMFGGRSSVPMVLWAIVNRGGEQGAQHSQSLHALFAHVPGLKVVMPSTPHDAKGLMVSAIQDNDPVVFIDERWLYSTEDEVPEDFYSIPLGRGVVRRVGRDVTLVSASFLSKETVRAAEVLAEEGIDAEVIDLRTIKPLDSNLVLSSLKKTGRLVVVDGGWRTCGFAAEVAALAAEAGPAILRAPVVRITLPDIPAPVSTSLEEVYYFGYKEIVQRTKGVMS